MIIERPEKTRFALVWPPPKSIRGKPATRTIAIMTISLGLLTLLKYVFHLDLRLPQALLFVASICVSVFVLNRLRPEHRVAQNSPPESAELFEQSRKMEAVGRLAGGLAHDFNNLLAVITGYSDLVLESLDPSDLNRPKVEQIKQAANSAASLTRQLLMFTRQQVVQPVTLDINQTVSNIEKMLRRLIKENIKLTVVLDRSIDRIKADPGQIEQIILNLAVNARDAMPNGGSLCIQTRNVRLAGGTATAADARSHQFVLMEVTDTGAGMDEQTQARVFEPFFTTKMVGQGTGLGLATVHEIVKQSKGRIKVQSTLGQGSSFKIYFPAVERANTHREPDQNTALPVLSATTVLVVEDAQPLAEVICEGLRRYGCEVLPARDGQQALRMLREGQIAVDLLLTDVIMPGMNGPDLVKEVRLLRPQTKILYMTGYSGEFVRADMLAAGVSLIQKPFTPADLGRKISKMLADKYSDAATSQESSGTPKAAAARTSG